MNDTQLQEIKALNLRLARLNDGVRIAPTLAGLTLMHRNLVVVHQGEQYMSYEAFVTWVRGFIAGWSERP